MTSPYPSPARPPRAPDSRPLYKRTRVWIGGLAVFALGVLGGTQNGRDAAVAAAESQPTQTVSTTATATETVTATPKPTATVTKTAKARPAPTVTVTVTETADSLGSSTGGGGGSTYYSNCSEARAAGVTPLYAGDPGYDSHLDRDGDGVACE